MDRTELGVPGGKQEHRAACCFVVLELCWAVLGGCAVAPGGMKRVGPQLLPLGGGGASEEHQLKSPVPVPSLAQHSTQHNTTQHNTCSATQGQRNAAPSPLHDEGSWPKERNDETDGMAPGQQRLRSASHAHTVARHTHQQHHPIPAYTAFPEAARRHDTISDRGIIS